MNEPRIIINVGVQWNGYVFQVEPTTRVWLENNFPDRQRVSSLFIRFSRKKAEPHIADSMWSHIWQLVTGLSAEEITQSGGLIAISPTSKQVIYQSEALYV